MIVSNTRRLALAVACSALLSACGGGGGDSGTTTDVYGWNGVTALKTTDATIGTGATAASGNTVSVTYTGYLYDVRVANTKGTKFDSNVGGAAFSFKLGAGAVISGFDQGITGMKVGGKRTITMPASLAYGSTGAGTAIPPNAALVFDVELLSVQ
jgi:FKBP-type peptidyl-prolyl cis-trans isomerase